ncbi:hypothetical protein [Vibrio sp. 10N.261.46.A3]
MTSVSRAFLCVEYGANDVIGRALCWLDSGKTDIYAMIGITLTVSGGH